MSGEADDGEKTTAFRAGALDEPTVVDAPHERTVDDESDVTLGSANERTVDSASERTLDEPLRVVRDDATVDDSSLSRVAPTDPPAPASRDLARTEPPGPIEEPTAASDELAPLPKRKTSRWRFVGWFFAALFVALAVGGAVVALYWDAIIRAVIVAEAKRHGIELSFDAVDVRRDRLVFSGAHVHAEELSNVDLRAEHMTVTLDPRFSPTSTAMTGVHIAISDAPGVAIAVREARADIVDFAPQKLALTGVDVSVESVESLMTFARIGLTPPLVSLAPAVSEVHVGVARVADAWPLALAIDAASVAMSAGNATFHKLKTTIPLVDVPVALDTVEIAHENAAFTVRVAEAPYVELGLDERATALHIVLKKVPADLLAEKLHWSRPPGFALSATADLVLPHGKSGDPTGTFAATLDHYVPPHPIELDGIVFGDATKGRGAFKLHGAEADLTDLHVDAGDLHMTGAGKAVATDSGKITLSLDGSVPCNELAVSAVAAHLGLAAGFITGEITRDHLAGTVEVKLGVEIEGKKASQPTIRPAAFVHCTIALL